VHVRELSVDLVALALVPLLVRLEGEGEG